MSIASRSRDLTLRAPSKTESPSGAKTTVMLPERVFRASITQLSERAIAQMGVKHTTTTHLILTSYRLNAATEEKDVLDGATAYDITSVVHAPRRTLIYASIRK